MVRPKPLCGLCSPAAPNIGNRWSLLVKPVVCKVLFVFPGLKSRLRTGFLLYRRLPPLSHSDYHSLLFPFEAPHPAFRGSCWSQLTLSPGRDPARIRELDDSAVRLSISSASVPSPVLFYLPSTLALNFKMISTYVSADPHPTAHPILEALGSSRP